MTHTDTIATRGSLIARLKTWEDHESWSDFDRTYRGLVRKLALRAGLAESDADEVAQETMSTVARHMADFEYDRSRCRFKTWLINLARWRIVDQLRRRWSGENRQLAFGDTRDEDEQLHEIEGPGATEFERLWNEEIEEHLLNAALAKVRRRIDPKQYQIFYLAVRCGTAVAEVARRLGVSAMQVYLARHRVGKLVTREVAALRQESG